MGRPGTVGLVCVVAVLGFSVCVFGEVDYRGALEAGSHDLAAAFLEVNNSREGIEYMGGPFLLEDYHVGGRKYRTYNYKRPLGLEGCPDSFDIEILSGADPDMRGKLNRPISKDTLPILEKVAGAQTAEICRVLGETFSVTEADERKELLQVVEIDLNGRIRSYHEANIYLYSARKLGDGCMQLIFREVYTPSELWSDLGTHDEFVEKPDHEWVPLSMLGESFERGGNSGRRGLSREKFFVIGEIGKAELRKVVELVKKEPSREKLFAMWVLSEKELKDMSALLKEPLLKGGVYVYLGPRRHCGMPKHVVTLAPKGDSWEVVGTAGFLDTWMEFRVVSAAPVSFMARPSKEEVQDLRVRLRWSGTKKSEGWPYENLLESDLLEICEMCLRVKGFAPCDLKIYSKKAGEAEVTQVWPGGAESLELKKLGGVWRVVNASSGMF